MTAGSVTGGRAGHAGQTRPHARLDDPVQQAFGSRQLQAPRQRSQLEAERFLAQREEVVHAVPPHPQTPPDMGCVRRHAQYRLNSDMAMLSADSASTLPLRKLRSHHVPQRVAPREKLAIAPEQQPRQLLAREAGVTPGQARRVEPVEVLLRDQPLRPGSRRTARCRGSGRGCRRKPTSGPARAASPGARGPPAPCPGGSR